jgi:hypothetical protein
MVTLVHICRKLDNEMRARVMCAHSARAEQQVTLWVAARHACVLVVEDTQQWVQQSTNTGEMREHCLLRTIHYPFTVASSDAAVDALVLFEGRWMNIVRCLRALDASALLSKLFALVDMHRMSIFNDKHGSLVRGLPPLYC